MHISIVSTLYLSNPYLMEFYERINKVVNKITDSYEIILVNDGSPDSSLKTALELCQKDKKVKVVDLSRNFGHHKAIMTGLTHASGELVFLIDSDLEEAPELLEDFYNQLKADQELDQVYGVQGETRKGNLFEQVSGEIWYRLMNFLNEEKIPKNFLTVRLMTKRFVKSLINFKETELNFSILVSLNGFNSKAIIAAKGHKNSSSYGILKKFEISINALTSSSTTPLWLIFYFGVMIDIIAALGVTYLILKKFAFSGIIHGWTSLMVINLAFGGTIMLSLGIIGLYVAKILREVKERPYTIIKDKYNF